MDDKVIDVSYGEFHPGQFVTVLTWKDPLITEQMDIEDMVASNGESSEGEIQMFQTFKNTSYMGSVLEVHAVALPFLLVENHTDPSEWDMIFSLDLRDVDVKELPEDYVACVKKRNKKILKQARKIQKQIQENPDLVVITE